MFKAMPKVNDDRLLVDFSASDDGAVFRLNDGFALVQTVDFFTPIVDDPADFGAISAANALSDIYAMGGEPLTALGLVCFPHKKFPIGILTEMNRSGAEKIHEGGAFVVGGHSVEDEVVKFGYAVTGKVHPDRVWRNHTVQAGDGLVLTKPLGTGLLTTAVKQGKLPETVLEHPVSEMRRLNRTAAELARQFEIHAATDVTGFGLFGHLFEMVRERHLGAVIQIEALPLFEGVWQAIEAGSLTGAHRTNFNYVEPYGITDNSAFEKIRPIVLDPQTSGGLLFALPIGQARDLSERLLKAGHSAALIGEISPNPGLVCR